MIDNYVLYKNLPSLDLHGENRESALVLVNEFIKDNIKLKNRLIKITHGKGTYILKISTDDIQRELPARFNKAWLLFLQEKGVV